MEEEPSPIRSSQPAFRKPVHDPSQRNYRRRSPSASTSPSPPPGGWKRDRSLSPPAAGDGKSPDHGRKERRVNAEVDWHRDSEASRSRKGDCGPGTSEPGRRNHKSDGIVRPDDRDKRSSNHHYGGHLARDSHDYHARQEGDHRSHDRGYRDRNSDGGRDKDGGEGERNRGRGREMWDRSREKERERERDRDRTRGRRRNPGGTRVGEMDVDYARDRSRSNYFDNSSGRDRGGEQAKDRDGDKWGDGRGRQGKDVFRHRERVKDRLDDTRDRGGRRENRVRDYHRDAADLREQRVREDDGPGSYGRRPPDSDRGWKAGSKPDQEREGFCGARGGVDKSPRASGDEEKRKGGAGIVDDGHSDEDGRRKQGCEKAEDTDDESKLERKSQEMASSSKAEDGEIQNEKPVGAINDGDHYSDRPESTHESDLAQVESKKSSSGSETKLSKSSKWGPEANAMPDACPAAPGAEVPSDLSVAKLAALKAAEMVNKNLGASGFMSADQKKKLLWGAKKKEAEQEPVALAGTNRWDTVHFADRDRQEKFQKLMGVKGDPKDTGEGEAGLFTEERQRELQQDLEKQFTVGLRRRDGRTVGLGL